MRFKVQGAHIKNAPVNRHPLTRVSSIWGDTMQWSSDNPFVIQVKRSPSSSSLSFTGHYWSNLRRRGLTEGPLFLTGRLTLTGSCLHPWKFSYLHIHTPFHRVTPASCRAFLKYNIKLKTYVELPKFWLTFSQKHIGQQRLPWQPFQRLKRSQRFKRLKQFKRLKRLTRLKGPVP